MIIGISSTGNDADALLDLRFGRCVCFALYDTVAKTFRFVENKAQYAGGGAGIAAAQLMVDEGAEAIITGNMGPNAFRVMQGAGIPVYRCASATLRNAADLFERSRLEKLDTAGPAHMGMGFGGYR